MISTLTKTEFVGRDSDLLYLSGTVAPLYSNEFSGVFYVYGDAGIGKSRLVYEFTSKLVPEIQTTMMQTDDVLRKSQMNRPYCCAV